MIELPRRKFLTGLSALIAAPAIVRAASIMPVRSFVEDSGFELSGFSSFLPLDQIPWAIQIWQDRIFWLSENGIRMLPMSEIPDVASWS
jgi:hypothetical protein